jgi:RAB protein geranylgeranyltransferase component A
MVRLFFHVVACSLANKTCFTDVYIACVSSAHNVCPKGYWIAIVSTIAETTANHHLELQSGLDRLGKIEEQFMVRAPAISGPSLFPFPVLI